MLKRLLTIGLVLTFGLVVAGAAPPATPTEIPEADREGSITGEVGGRSYVMWWVYDEDDGPAGISPGPMTEAGRAIVDDAYQQLPPHIQASVDRVKNGQGSTNSQVDHWCTLVTPKPTKSGADKVYTDSWLACYGPRIKETRLKVQLQRQLSSGWWSTLATNDGGWKAVSSQSRSVKATCQGGTHDYRTKSQGWLKTTNNSVSTQTNASGSKSITC